MDPTTTLRKVAGVIRTDRTHWVGDGFLVRGLISPGGADSSRYDPFLLLDHAAPRRFEATTHRRGVGEHPHRGFETVTLALAGAVEHRDSSGGGGVIGPGEVQWMTAASGVVHSEYHEPEWARHGGEFHMVQLWVNLPGEHKMDAPRYQGLDTAAIGEHHLEGATVRVIAGRYEEVVGPGDTHTPIELYDIVAGAGHHVDFTTPAGRTSLLLVTDGETVINGQHARTGELVELQRSANAERIQIAGTQPARILYMGGEPIGEPVVAWGPFVMNTVAQIEQAIDDYNAGRFGHIQAAAAATTDM